MNGMAQMLPSVVGGFQPGLYQRDVIFSAKTVSAAADRYILLTPNRLAVDVGGAVLALTSQAALDLSVAATWDSVTTDYTVAANRAGKDFYVYACLTGGMVLKLVVSANATTPTGYSALTSRLVAGFHCMPGAIRHDLTLTAWAGTTAIAVGVTRKATTWDGRLYRCSTAGTTGGAEPTWAPSAVGAYIVDGTVTWIVEQHALEGYAAGDIMPASVWDLRHRHPISNVGATWDNGIRKWVMIYLPSWSGGRLVSVNGGTIADGTSTWDGRTGFNWYDFCERLVPVGYRPSTQQEFMSFSGGSPQQTNTAGSADPGTTGPHQDTSGRSIISDIGVIDACGVAWQLGLEAGAVAGTAAFKDQFVAAKTSQRGQGYQEPTRVLLGGDWISGVLCGSRCSRWDFGPLSLAAILSARGVADTIGGM